MKERVMDINVATVIRRLADLGVERGIIAKAVLVSTKYVDRVLDAQAAMEASAIELRAQRAVSTDNGDRGER